MSCSMKKKLAFGAVALAVIGGANAVDGTGSATTSANPAAPSSTMSNPAAPSSMARGAGEAANGNPASAAPKSQLAENTSNHRHHRHRSHHKSNMHKASTTVGTTAGSANMHSSQPGVNSAAQAGENVSANINMPAHYEQNNAVTGSNGKALLAVNDANSYSSEDSDDSNVFQRFDNQAALGVSLTAGSLGGVDFTNYGANIDVSKLYDNGIWFNVSDNEAMNNSMSMGAANSFSGSLGYAFQIGNMFEIIPNVEAQRTQLNGTAQGSTVTQQATITDALADVRLELATSRYFNIFADGGAGLASYNLTGASAGTTVENCSSGGIIQAGAGVNYRPIANEPWILNAQYFYQDYNQANIGAINGVLVSTGITF